MTNYELAKLVQLAGGLESRKRIQKTVHLLQAAGCDFGLHFRLHHYGPYCSELAEKVDRMVSNNILRESKANGELGVQYNYEFNEDLDENLEEFERSPEGQEAKTRIERRLPLLKELERLRPRVLELASTIAFYRLSELGWNDAVEKAAEFKQERADSPYMREARQIAEKACAFDG